MHCVHNQQVMSLILGVIMLILGHEGYSGKIVKLILCSKKLKSLFKHVLNPVGLNNSTSSLSSDCDCRCCFLQIQVSYYPPGQFASTGQQYRVSQPVSHQVSYPAQRSQPMPQPTQQSGWYSYVLQKKNC